MERKFEDIKGKPVKHFKGKLYLVIDLVIHSETQSEMVLYKALYGDFKLFVRPKDMFLSEVDREKYPEVKQKYRFDLLTSDDMDNIKDILIEK